MPCRSSSSRRRVPRARIDPIRTPAAALRLASAVLSCPGRDETVAFLLDDAYRGTGIVYDVTGTDEHDSVVRVAEMMAEDEAGVTGAAHLVILSVRPHRWPSPDDAALWCRASDVVEAHGITLLEWFVVDDSGLWTPRDLTGEPDRWPR